MPAQPARRSGADYWGAGICFTAMWDTSLGRCQHVCHRFESPVLFTAAGAVTKSCHTVASPSTSETDGR